MAAVRLYDGETCTSLCRIDPQSSKLTEFLKLPSGGATSYAGLVLHNFSLEELKTIEIPGIIASHQGVYITGINC